MRDSSKNNFHGVVLQARFNNIIVHLRRISILKVPKMIRPISKNHIYYKTRVTSGINVTAVLAIYYFKFFLQCPKTFNVAYINCMAYI